MVTGNISCPGIALSILIPAKKNIWNISCPGIALSILIPAKKNIFLMGSLGTFARIFFPSTFIPVGINFLFLLKL
jgi:hypothetical protein